MNDLGIHKEGGTGKYLGLPEHFGRKKRDTFTSIVDKIRARAASWSNRHLSPAGKLTLLKVVLAAIPNHAMQCFKLPQSLCKRIQSALTRFFWDPKEGQRGMSLISWDTMMKSKKDGGLGVRDIQSFNDALLAKISWRILSKPSCLLARVLEGKYFHNEDFLQAKAPSACSHGWRGILIGRDLLKEHLSWAIGNGSSVLIWQDPWLSTSQKISPMGPAPLLSANSTVSTLFKDHSTEWDTQKIENLLPLLLDPILSIKPSKCGGPDRRIWLNQSSGVYTAKTGYYTALEKNHPSLTTVPQAQQDWISDVWRIPMSPKLKLLIWKIKHNALPVGEMLVARQIILNSKCARCEGSESILHLFFHYPFAQKVWDLAHVSTGLKPLLIGSFTDGWKLALKETVLPPHWTQ